MLCALPILALAQAPASYALRGTVTIVQPHWQFYTNLGAREQIEPGAMLRIVRDGVVIGTARVFKVSPLDSLAELTPQSPRVLLQAGDNVLVQSNPVVISPSGRLPWIEPNLDMSQFERDALAVVLIAIAIAVID
jgi:hypothetical protein